MQYKRLFPIVAVGAMVSIIALNVSAAPVPWPRVEFDAARTHYFPNAASREVSFADFAPLWTAPLAAGAVVTGDINGDGKLEVLVYAYDNNQIQALGSDGTPLWSIPISSAASGPLVSDVTGDGVPEVLVGDKRGGQLVIDVYDGQGNLLKTISRPGGFDSGIRPVVTDDFDGDGDYEISAVIDAGYSWWTFPESRGVSLFDFQTGSRLWHYAMGPANGGIAYGDVNEDGHLDAIKNAGTVHNGPTGCGVGGGATCTNDSEVATIVADAVTGNEIFTRFYGHGHGIIEHAIVDLDRDGNSNILAFWGHDAPCYPGPFQVMLLDDAGSTLLNWTGPQNRSVYSASWAVADLDGDGRDEVALRDFAARCYGPVEDLVLRILEDDLSSQVAENSTIVNVPGNEVCLYVADLNGDGSNDILVGDYVNGRLRVLDNTLTEVWSFPAPHLRNIALGDLNNDGICELLLAGDQLLVLGASPNWCDGFESYASGSNASPPWYLSGNTSGVTVDNSIAYSGEKSLKMFGLLGSCWGAVADRQYSGLPLLITMAVRNGSEPLSGCHPYRASCGLRTGCPEWQCCPCPQLFVFLANGDFWVPLGGSPTVFTGYALNAWHQVKCYLWTPGDGSLHVKYWVNGEYLGEFLTPEEPWMHTAGYLDIGSQEGTAWFDDVCVSSGRAEICDAFITPQRVHLRCFLSLDRVAPQDNLVPLTRRHSFMIHLRPCVPMDVSIGDSADVFVDVDGSGAYDPDERYPAVVSGTDHDGAASDVAIKVYVDCDLIDNDPHVAIYAVGGLNLVDSDGNPIDYLQVDTFKPGRGMEEVLAAQAANPAGVTLYDNVPNPFNPSTSIRFYLPEPAEAGLEVYNTLGEKVATLVNGNLEARDHVVQWDATRSNGQQLPSGIYFYRLTVNGQAQTKKMVLVR